MDQQRVLRVLFSSYFHLLAPRRYNHLGECRDASIATEGFAAKEKVGEGRGRSRAHRRGSCLGVVACSDAIMRNSLLHVRGYRGVQTRPKKRGAARSGVR